MTTVGVIGLGNMGAGMAANLVRGGHEVVVRDVRIEPVRRLEDVGALAARSNFEIGTCCEVVFLAVFDGQAVVSVCLGDAGDPGVLAGMRDGGTIVVHSTVDAGLIRRLAEAAGSPRIQIVDAPMTGGGHKAAEAGTLTFFVGGSPDAVTAVVPYLELMGTQVLHVGALGSGMLVKVISNFLSIGTTLLVNEALCIGRAYDLDGETVLSMIEVGKVGASWVSTHWDEIRSQERDYTTPGGMAEMARKDLGLAMAFATESGCEAATLQFLVERVAPSLKRLTYDG